MVPNKNKNNKKRSWNVASTLSTMSKVIILLLLATYWIALLFLGNKGMKQSVSSILLVETTAFEDDISSSTNTNNTNTSVNSSITSNINLDNNIINNNSSSSSSTPNNNNNNKNKTNDEPYDYDYDYDYDYSKQMDTDPPLLLRSVYSPRIPLLDLVNTGPDPPCNETGKELVMHTIVNNYNYSAYYINNNINNNSSNSSSSRKIPKIVHLTTKSRCMTSKFAENINNWRMDGYSVFIHDDAAVKRLIQQDWPEFPHLQLIAFGDRNNNNENNDNNTMNNENNNNNIEIPGCIQKGASMADLWRYLVLWEYGGIYADIDSAPGRKLLNSKNRNGFGIKDDDDAFFVIERLGIMSQYFMAGSPKHPYFHLCVTVCLGRVLHLVSHVGKQAVAIITGPGVVKVAMMRFMQNIDTDNPNDYQRVTAGVYTGVANRTIRVVGSKRNGSKDWVKRDNMSHDKHDGYASMGMQHFSAFKLETMDMSCFEYLYNQYVEKNHMQ